MLSHMYPAIGPDGTIYASSTDGSLYALNPDGSEKWIFEVGFGAGFSPPAIGYDGTIYLGSARDSVYAINPDDSQKWIFYTGDDVSSSPAIGADGTIYAGSDDDNFYAINPDGSQKWAFTAGGDFDSTPAVGKDGTIYVGSNDDNHYAINPDGTQKWAFKTGGDVNSSPAIAEDGTIYFGSDDGRLYALKGSSGGLADTPWPKYYCNNSNSALYEYSGDIPEFIDPLQVFITTENATGPLPLEIALSCSLTGGTPPYEYAWSFGDGSTSSEEKPSHAYISEGEFQTKVTVTDANGQTASAEAVVTVSGSLGVQNHAPNTPNSPSPTTSSSGAVPTTLNWSGGDEDGDAVTYTVIFGTDPANLETVAVLNDVTSWDITGQSLRNGFTNYWRVIAADANESVESDVWNFTAAIEEPRDGCASFDQSTSLLHVPCVNIMEQQSRLELKLINLNPVTLEFVDMGPAASGLNCTTFDFLSSTVHIPCLDVGISYRFDLVVSNNDPVRFELINMAEN